MLNPGVRSHFMMYSSVKWPLVLSIDQSLNHFECVALLRIHLRERATEEEDVLKIVPIIGAKEKQSIVISIVDGLVTIK